MDYIAIDTTSSTPIYKQIGSIHFDAIDKNIIKQKGDLIPSVNKIAAQFSWLEAQYLLPIMS